MPSTSSSVPTPPGPSAPHSDCVVVGGGIIGLSLAYELACRGAKVTLLERGRVGREASWAGAGILPPGSWYDDHPLLERLAQASHALHAEWSNRLREETGINDEHHACGGWYLPTPETAKQLEQKFRRWSESGIAVERRPPPSGVESRYADKAYYLPTECQVRNPRRLKALADACKKRGVSIIENCEVRSLLSEEGRVHTALSSERSFPADQFCITAGCWSDGPLASLETEIHCRPVRGQMLLFKPSKYLLTTNVHQADRYVTPRQDGRVLVGSTLEEVGYDKTTDHEAIQQLTRFAHEVVPALQEAEVEAIWAGLRPASPDGLPRMGIVPGAANTWVSTGHYRAGLLLSPIAARLMAQQMNGEQLSLPAQPNSAEPNGTIDLRPFALTSNQDKSKPFASDGPRGEDLCRDDLGTCGSPTASPLSANRTA